MISMSGGEERSRQWQQDDGASTSQERRSSTGFWVMLLLAAAAVGKIVSLRRRFSNFHRMQEEAHNAANRRGGSFHGPGYYGWWSFKVGGPTYNGRFRYEQGFQESQRFKQTPFFWDEIFEELERKERIRHMQDTFNRERASTTRGYEKWQEHSGTRDQFFEENQYWEGAKEKMDHERQYRSDLYKRAGLRQHYSVLGLDPLRPQPYNEAEIKAAFRQKVLQYHPDRNQGNKEYSEVKFRQVMDSYEVLKRQHKFS